MKTSRNEFDNKKAIKIKRRAIIIEIFVINVIKYKEYIHINKNK